MRRFINWLCRYMTIHMSNRFLIFCLQVMRRLQRHGEMFALGNGESDYSCDGFIENQRELADVYMGMATMAEAGCEIIATYNALLNLGRPVALGKLICTYERDGIMHSGKFGVSPKAIVDYLKSAGVKTSIFIKKKKSGGLDEFAEEFKTLIVTYYNDMSDLTKEIHTVAVTRDDDGFKGHNVHGNITGAYKSVSELIDKATVGKGDAIMLIGIDEKG